MKTRPSKTQILIWKFIPITHSIIYHYQKAKKSFLWRKSCWRSWSSWRSSLIALSLGSTVIGPSIGFSLIGFSLGSSAIGSSLTPQSWGLLQGPQFSGSSMLFFRHVAIFFLSNRAATFLSKIDVLFYIKFSKRSSFNVF